MSTLARRWRRREPQDTVLYQVLAAHLETFVARLEDDDARAPLPRFVVGKPHDFLGASAECTVTPAARTS